MKKLTQLSVFILTSLLFLSEANAQHQKISEIKGVVIDQNENPITYAHVFLLANQNRGTITNEEGKFVFPIFKNTTDSLVISALGFENFVFALDSTVIQEDLTLSLKKSSLILDEITIFDQEYLKYLLTMAVERFPLNYPNSKHQLSGYFQEYTISDTSYSEVIEMDLIVECDSYSKKKIKPKYYKNELRKSDDNRNLPERLKGTMNQIYLTFENIFLISKTFDRYRRNNDKSISGFKDAIKDLDLQYFGQQVQNGDTLITIKLNSSLFKYKSESVLFSLITINKSDFAVLKIVQGSIWSEKSDYDEMQFRKVNDTYFPTYIRTVLSYEFNNKTQKNYNSKTMIFYNYELDKNKFAQTKRKDKLKKDQDIRDLKYNYNSPFWDSYRVSEKASASSALRSALNKNGDLERQYKFNEKGK